MQSFAKTFVCDNWSNFLKQELEGTMFEGEIDGDNFTIKDFLKGKLILTHIGGDPISYTYYINGSGIFLRVFSIGIKENALKYTKSKDEKKQKLQYDLKISELWGDGVVNQTFCNYQ